MFGVEWLLVSTFWLESDTSSTFSLHFAQPSYELERPALKTEKCSYVGAELTFVAENFPDYLFLMTMISVKK